MYNFMYNMEGNEEHEAPRSQRRRPRQNNLGPAARANVPAVGTGRLASSELFVERHRRPLAEPREAPQPFQVAIALAAAATSPACARSPR